MTTLDERPSGGPQDAAAGRSRTQDTGPRAATAGGADAARPTDTRLRVVLLLDVLEGRQDQFLQAYERIRHQVAAVPGHISDQLCQSLGNSSQWLITSEWQSSEPFLEWVESATHRAMVEPLHGCVRDTTSLRFVVARETPDPADGGARRTEPAVKSAARHAAPGESLDPLPAPPLCSGGVVRHAITFTVKPGSEAKAAKLLANYESPSARVDDTTRLLRTSLYMHGNRVVRAVEVSGDLGNALRHVASQPGVRAVEEALTPYLEDDRDMTDAASARAFFARAALPAIAHTAADRPGEVVRMAYVHAVPAAQGPAEASRLSEADAADCARDAHPLAAATCYQRGDVLVRVLDVRAGAAVPAELARGGRPMDPITDRTAQDA